MSSNEACTANNRRTVPPVERKGCELSERRDERMHARGDEVSFREWIVLGLIMLVRLSGSPRYDIHKERDHAS